MKELRPKGLDDIIYYDKLDNGLEVYLVPNSKRNMIYATYTTKYGTIHNEFIPIGENKYRKFPAGIAHFLEHKLFEEESGIDPFAFFAKNGAKANANTSFFRTSYLFYGIDNLKDNLNYLLDYVGNLYLTDENVEKEKGIIEQEFQMYEDIPVWVLNLGILANTFKKHPIRENMVGSLKSIRSITKEDLISCYNTFYHPSNMILIVTGNIDINETMGIIQSNQSKKEYSKIEKIDIKKHDEPREIVKELEQKEMPIEVPKIALGIKISTDVFKDFDPKVVNLYLGVLGRVLFGKSSSFYEEMIEKEYLVSNFYLEKITIDNYIFVTIKAESNQPQKLLEEIKKYIKNIKINAEDFERKKKILINSYFTLFDDVEAVNDKILDNIIKYNKLYLNEIDMIKELNIEELNKFVKLLDLSYIATYIIIPKKTT
jgi:predicted Zn-dependent peptidase